MKQREPNLGATARLTENDYFKLAAVAVATASVGGPVAVDPDVADAMGAFDEPALSLDDALDSLFDGVDPTALNEVKGNG
tara:strand:+ start:41 stop:280 length:240 start_codon:yes stop_codon:yes gene_type:complete